MAKQNIYKLGFIISIGIIVIIFLSTFFSSCENTLIDAVEKDIQNLDDMNIVSLTLQASPSSGGKFLDSNGDEITSDTIIVNKDTTIIIEAVAETGYDFLEWNASSLIENRFDPIIDVSITDFDATITANFTPQYYDLVINYNNLQGAVDYDGVEIPAGNSVSAQHSQSETLEAIPETGYIFDQWIVISGNPTFAPNDLEDSSVSISIIAEAEISATFIIAPTPKMEIEQGGNSIIHSSGAYDFGTIFMDTSGSEISFIIYNTGEDNLNLDGGPIIQVLGGSSDMFTVSQFPSIAISPGFSSDFKLQFSPKTIGDVSATISIPNTDQSNDPYQFTVTGYGTGIKEVTTDGYYGYYTSLSVKGGYIHSALGGGPPQGGDWTWYLKYARSADSCINWSIGNLLSHTKPIDIAIRVSEQYSNYVFTCFTIQEGFVLKSAYSTDNGTSWTNNANFSVPTYMTDRVDMDISGGNTDYYYIGYNQLNVDPLIKRLSLRRNTIAGNYSNWEDHTIDDGPHPDFISIEGGGTSYLYVSYQNRDSNNLKFARCTNLSTYNTWDVQILDSSSATGFYSCIGSNGIYIYVSYYDATNDQLKFIRNTNYGVSTSWSSPSVIDLSGGNMGEYSSLALVGSDDIYISYYDNTNNNLKFARSLDGGNNWSIKTVDDSGLVAPAETEIKVDSGVIYIVYSTDMGSGIRNLKIAKSIDDGDTW